MKNSIHQFAEEGVKRLSKVFEEYTEDLTKIAEMVTGVTDEVVNLGATGSQKSDMTDRVNNNLLKRPLVMGYQVVSKPLQVQRLLQ